MKKIVSLIIFVVSFLVILSYFLIYIGISIKNNYEINTFYNNKVGTQKSDKILIGIPKINLRVMVKKAKKDFSNLDRGLVYYENINPKKTIIIFGHSGVGYGTYFRNLDKLDNDDLVYLKIGYDKIKYIVYEKKYISKYEVNLLNDINYDKGLYLITCKKDDKDRRLILKLRKDG